MKKQFHNENNIINAENLQHIANAITIRALKTNFANSGNKTIEKMYYDAVRFAKNPTTASGGDGASLIQDTVLYLWGYNGKKLTDKTTDGQTDKNGEPITILRGAFRNIRKIIYGHEKKQYTQIYLEDYESENGVIAVPFKWDTTTYEDYITVRDIIKALELTENQRYILNKRMQGLSLQQIADTKNTSKQAIANTLAKIGKKYINLYGEISVPTLKKILSE